MPTTSKILFIILVTCCLPESLYCQNYNLNLKNTTVKDAIELFRQRSGYNIVFESDDLDTKKIISVHITNGTVEDIMKAIVTGQNVAFSIKDNRIIIFSTKKRLTSSQTPARITGTVISKDGRPISGASILDLHSGKRTFTDNNGNFALTVPEGEKLKISYVGYTQHIVKTNPQKNIRVTLEESDTPMNEVVVVGYGTQKRESLVGAFSTISERVLNQTGIHNATNVLSGRLSGVLTMQQSGEPGNDNSEIIIRGVSSWNGSSPTVIVDGVERDFKDLDPADISSVSVLKDASATAVFGAKGANGVILVTTKRGIKAKPRLEMNYTSGLNFVTGKSPFIDSYQTMSLLNVAAMNGQQYELISPNHILNEYKNPSTPLNSLRYPNVDWFSLLTNSVAQTQYANINIRGGSQLLKYYCSLGWYQQGSLLNPTKEGYIDTRFLYNRFTYRTNVDFTLTPTSTLSVNVGGVAGIKNQPAASIWESIFTVSPARFPAWFPDWVLALVPDPDYPDAKGKRFSASFGEFRNNPWSLLNNGSFARYFNSTLYTDLAFSQQLNFITGGLSATAKVSLSTYYQNLALSSSNPVPEYQLDYDKIGVPGTNPWTGNVSGQDVYTNPPVKLSANGPLQNNYYSDYYLETGINYKRSFNAHAFTGLALFNRKQKNDNVEFPYYNQGFVTRVTYNYALKYLAEFNMGYTGSEQFAPGHRYGFFPSIGIGWVPTEEAFIQKTFPWINKMKLRYSDGLVGSDNATARWLYISDYLLKNGYIYEDKIGNSAAQWERARKRNLGLEMSILQNSLSFTIDLFDEFRDKMLLTPMNATMLIGNSFKDLNKGSIKKHGLEIETTYRNKIDRNWNFTLNALFGISENRVIYKDDPLYAPDYMKAGGKPMDAQLRGVTLSDNGYFKSVDEIHNNPSPVSLSKLNVGDYKYIDYNADGLVSTLDLYPVTGSLYPPITYSFSASAHYKSFVISILFQGNAGKYVVFNSTYEAEFNQGDYRLHASQLNFWTPANQNSNHATLHYVDGGSAANLSWGGGDSYSGYAVMIADRFWRKADYLRLKELYMAYQFQSLALQRNTGIRNIMLYATANNLITLTSLIEGDPERKNFYNGYYPLMATVSLGMKFTF